MERRGSVWPRRALKEEEEGGGLGNARRGGEAVGVRHRQRRGRGGGGGRCDAAGDQNGVADQWA
jgi:hypothetical protein